MYCRVEDRQSNNAGIINKYYGTFDIKPFYIALFYYCSYFYLFLERYTMYIGKEINIATNIIVALIMKILLGDKDEKTTCNVTLHRHIENSEILKLYKAMYYIWFQNRPKSSFQV